MKIINCEKRYKDKLIFEKLNMEFDSGIYHIKGQNGVGKSVFCRCLLGLEDFSGGEVVDKGKNTLFLPETPLGEDWLSMQENIELLLYYYDISLDDSEKDKICKELEIWDLDQNYHTVSVGTAMKIGMLMLFVEKKWNLIVIDEALSHLDSGIRKKIILELEKRAMEGTIILIVDHNLEADKSDDLWNEIVLGGSEIWEK